MILFLVFAVCLVDCTGKSLQFKVESIDAELNTEYSSHDMLF